MMSKIIGVIGCGNMGEAILAQARGAKKNFLIFEKNKIKARFIRAKYHLKAALDIPDLVRKSDIIIIAVKPQVIDEVLAGIKKGIQLNKKNSSLIISIAAGITTEYIGNIISGKVRVIRAMPNLAAKVGQGVTAFTKGRFAGSADLSEATKIFAPLGLTVYVNKEELIDVVTALSGSGPAYFFYIFSAMLKAAQELGLDRKRAELFIQQAAIGAMALLGRSKFDADGLIKGVASKGGTTEAALKIFNDKRLDKIIREAMLAAYKRAGELSR